MSSSQLSLHESARFYAEHFGAVHPLMCRDKEPTIPDWGNHASRDIATIDGWWKSRPQSNIGFLTKDFWVFDVDKEDGRKSFAALVAEHGELPHTLCAITGEGKHYYFRQPPDFTVRNTKGKIAPSIDTRGDGGYVLVPPSVHPTGAIYRWADGCSPAEFPPDRIPQAPAWLLDKLRPAPQAPRVQMTPEQVEAAWSATQKRLNHQGMNGASGTNYGLAALDKECHAIISAMDGYQEKTLNDAALKIGGLIPVGHLQEAYARSRLEAAGNAMPSYNPKKPWTPDLIAKKVDRALRDGMANPRNVLEVGHRASIPFGPAHHLQEASQMTHDPETGEVFEAAAPVEVVERPRPPKLPIPQVEPLPDPLTMPGLIGDTVRWICDTSFMEQPTLALLNTLAFAGAVFGRRYSTIEDVRSNIYTVGIAKSSQGKDFSRKKIHWLAREAGLDIYKGPDNIISGAGLAGMLRKQASQFVQIDEFGHFLQSLSDPKAAGYRREIASMLLKLYSDSRGEYDHGEYASKDERIKIKAPNLCVYGTTTLETYLQSFKQMAIADGSLGRFIVLEGIKYPKIKETYNTSRSIPANLVFAWSHYAPEIAGSDAENIGDAYPTRITNVDYAERVHKEIYLLRCEAQNRQKADEVSGALWGRWVENALKVAMIMAITRQMDRRDPIVLQMDDLNYGALLVSHSIIGQVTIAAEYMSSNEKEAGKLEVMRFIKEAGASGVKKMELLRRFQRFEKQEIDKMLDTLIESELIELVEVPTTGRGRKPQLYRSL